MTLITGFTCPSTIYFKFITKCDKCYYKVRRLLQSATVQTLQSYEKETNALNESRGAPEIITSKADKGGVVVGYQGLKKKKFKSLSFKFIYYI